MYGILLLIILLGTHESAAWSWQSFSNYFNSYKEEAPIKKEVATNANVLVDLDGKIGDVTVKSWNKSVVAIEAIKQGTPEQLQATHVRITVSPATVSIVTSGPQEQTARVSYHLMVPRAASLTLSLQQGSIDVKKVEGTLSTKTREGDITLHGTLGNSTAKTTYGIIKVQVKELPITSSLFLETFKGTVDVALPEGINATLTAKTVTGTVSSTLPVNLSPQAIMLNREAWARFKKEAVGTLGSGGAPITIEVTRGNIALTRRDA